MDKKASSKKKIAVIFSAAATAAAVVYDFIKDPFFGGDYFSGWLSGRHEAKAEEEKRFDDETTRSIMKRAEKNRDYRKGAIFKDEE